MDTTEDPEQRVADAKASLEANLRALGRRLKRARFRVDPRMRIAAHPLAAAGFAFAFGALLGMVGRPRRRRPAAAPPARTTTTRSAVLGALGALVVRFAREAAFARVGSVAKRMWAQSAPGAQPARADAAGARDEALMH